MNQMSIVNEKKDVEEALRTRRAEKLKIYNVQRVKDFGEGIKVL
jgi:hypothetical protein